MNRLLTTALACMALASANVRAADKGKTDNGPSAQETVEFINGLFGCAISGKQVEKKEGELKTVTYKQSSNLLLHNVQLSLTETSYIWTSFATMIGREISKLSDMELRQNIVAVSPKDMLSDSVEVREKSVVLNCSASAGACFSITKKEKFKGCSDTYEVSDGGQMVCKPFEEELKDKLSGAAPENTATTSWHMNFCDEDKAQRAARAMKHLIEISGGKKSLF